MKQDTSVNALKSVRPYLGQRQAEVMAVFNEPDTRLTNNEIAQRLGWSINCVTPRVFELRAMGKLTSFGKRPCAITGKTSMVWGKPYQRELF